jgi:glycosyltransferase involved in cell wall biosynthesis
MPRGLRELVEYGLGLQFLETELFEARERLARRSPTDLECMLIAGKSLYELGELDVANQVLASAFELAEATKNDAAVLDCLFSTTKVLVELEAYDAAKRALQMGLETARRTDDPGAIIQALLNAASAQHRAGEPEAGGAAVRQALDVAHRCGSPFALSQCSIGASEVYLEWGEHEKARALLEQSLHHARTLDDRVVRVRATGHLAKLWKELGDAQRAKTYAVEAIRLAEASNDESLLQRTRMGCAEVLTAIDETSLAVELLEETIRDATQAEDGVTVGRARFLVERVALPEKDRGEERRQTRTDTLAAAGARVTARARPRILLLADRPGWAFDVAAKAVARQLAHKYEFRISYVLRQPSLELWPFDAVHVFWWGETYHHRAGVEPSRVIKEIASYRWALEERYGCLTPEEAARTYLADARTLTTVSKRLQQTFAPHRDVLFVPNGYDPAVFHDRGARSGALRIGWAGNAADPCKGLEDILKPALTDGLELRIAGGGVRHRDMAEFYNSVDVLCVASTAEGEPLTLLEAMACGCYPVAVDVGMVPELVRHQENGLIVERRVDAFREAFSWCRDHVGLIRDAGRENSVLCRETRTWESVAEFWDRAFQTALDEQQQRDPAGDGRVNEREAAISGGAR